MQSNPVRIPVSVLILTKNEEQDLPACLTSVAWSDDIHVFDSFSTDGTVDVARAFGARVTQRVFDSYSAQRNAALTELDYKYPWLLILDADEIIPSALAIEIEAFLKAPPSTVSACRIRRRDYFWGRWLKHAQLSPYFIRLCRIDRVHYEREINEVLIVDGEIVQMRQDFFHYPFSKGLTHWIDKHNLYSSMEAKLIVEVRIDISWNVIERALFCKNFNERRYYQKAIFYHLPLRPVVKLLYMILVRRSFMDGYPGLVYSILQSIYEYFIVIKANDLRRSAIAGR